LFERVGPTIDIVEAKNEDTRQTEEWIRPIAAKLRGFPEQGDGFAELPLRVVVFVPLLGGFAIDTSEMALAVAKRGEEPAIVGCRRYRPPQRIAG
jgi:hypothetical protein